MGRVWIPHNNGRMMHPKTKRNALIAFVLGVLFVVAIKLWL